MNPPVLPPAVEVLTVQAVGDRWRVSSSDGLFEGMFIDARTAMRCAEAEAEAHPAYGVVTATPFSRG